MTISTHEVNDIKIAEVIADDIVITNVGDATDLLGDLYYQGFDHVIVHQKNIIPDFFDLKTGIAGKVLQKFSNYRVGLAIVGEFRDVQSKSLSDFIFESNRFGGVNFVETVEDGVERLTKLKS